MSTMLPAPPKSLGKLGEVLTSALGSVRGEINALGLPKRRSVLVALVDGLGLKNLQISGAHAGFLNSQKSLEASCFYPSTTSTSLVSFATGKPPWENNFIGYQVFDRSSEKSMNLLSGWESKTSGAAFQPLTTVSELASSQGIEFHTVGPAVYEQSGFTAATMRGAIFHGVNSIASRFEEAKRLLSNPAPKIVYLYIPELDQTAHAKGWTSVSWLNLLEDLDSLTSELASTLPKNTGVILTSDHGVVDIPKNNHIYLDELVSEDVLNFVGGDTRGLFLYLKTPTGLKETQSRLEQSLGDSCYVFTPEDLITAGYWQTLANQDISPDLIVLAKKQVALYHRGFAKKKSLEMIGHHGSITPQEMSIPLLLFGF